MFTWLAGILAFGELGFWILLLLSSFFIVSFIEGNMGFWATIIFIVTLSILYSVGTITFEWVSNHPYLAVTYLLGYLVVGALWAVFKWWRLVSNLREKYDVAKAEFLQNKGIKDTKIPDQFKKEWHNHIGRSTWSHRAFVLGANGIVPPNPNNHAEEIYLWIGFWPWNAVWFILDEPFRKMAQAIYKTIRSSLVEISNNAFKGTSTDFENEVTAKEAQE